MVSQEKIEDLQKIFSELDKDEDGLLTLEEAKQMMETLGDLETQLNLEELLQEMGLESDSELKINFQDFLSIYNKSQEVQPAGDDSLEITNGGGGEGGEETVVEETAEVAVHEVGVGGAKNFFEGKIEEQKGPSMEDEKKKILDEARKKKFQQKLAFFSQSQNS